MSQEATMRSNSAGVPLWHSLFLVLVSSLLPINSNSFLMNKACFATRGLSHHVKSDSRPSLVVISMNNARDADDADDADEDEIPGASSSNILGTTLLPCCTNVGGTGIGTGFYRNGYCCTGEQDLGRHIVCVRVTSDFLQFSASVGNDLSTPVPEYMFPGLRDGDIWCLCAQRWAQAYNAGMAPKVFLQATHEKTLDYVPYEILREFAIDKEEADKALNDLNEQRSRLNKLL